MKAIYEPKGKAREYGNLACNLYKGCGHGCTYCYAPKVLRMDRKEFYENPQPRKGIIEALKVDARKIKSKYDEDIAHYNSFEPWQRTWNVERPEVFLCFTCDPYQPINKKYQLTRQAIEILHANEIAVNILTKGRITDFDLLAKRPDLSKVGVTLTYATSCEPNRYCAGASLKNISTARKNGIKRWISFEPIILPDCVLNQIRIFAEDDNEIEFKLGKWNYDPRAKDIDWHKFVNEAIELLEKLGCKYYIKEDLRKYI